MEQVARAYAKAVLGLTGKEVVVQDPRHDAAVQQLLQMSVSSHQGDLLRPSNPLGALKGAVICSGWRPFALRHTRSQACMLARS